VRSAARRLLPSWLKKVAAACVACFTAAPRHAEKDIAKDVTQPADAKPNGVAAVALDPVAPPLHVIVPRTTWSAAAAAAATQTASQGEAPTSQPSDVAETNATSSADVPPVAAIVESAALPRQKPLPAHNPCRALVRYSALTPGVPLRRGTELGNGICSQRALHGTAIHGQLLAVYTADRTT